MEHLKGFETKDEADWYCRELADSGFVAKKDRLVVEKLWAPTCFYYSVVFYGRLTETKRRVFRAFNNGYAAGAWQHGKVAV